MGAGMMLEASRPQIFAAGASGADLDQGLLRLRVAEDQAGLCSCEATFGNWGAVGESPGYLYFDRETFDFGGELEVWVKGTRVFTGRISALEGSFPDARQPELTVLAEDRLQDLRMTRRTRSFEHASDADVFAQVASEHGLTAQVDVGGPTHRLLAQLDQSDLAFLRERARSIDAELWVDGSTLHVEARARRAGERVRLGLGNELRDFTVLADLAHQRSSVTVTGWDPQDKQPLAEDAGDAAVAGELGDGDSGASILRTALGRRPEIVSRTMPLGRAEARGRAEALFGARARRFVRGHAIAQCDPRLRVGATVRLDGLGPLFSGEYHVAEATIRFDLEHGLRTAFTAERPALGRAA